MSMKLRATPPTPGRMLPAALACAMLGITLLPATAVFAQTANLREPQPPRRARRVPSIADKHLVL